MPRSPLLLALAVLATGCDAAPHVAPPADAGPPIDAGWLDPVDAGVAAPDAGPRSPDAGPPGPAPLEPCARASCWDTELVAPRCVGRDVREDFSSGRYAVHDWATTLFADTPTVVRLEVTAGVWEPALILLGADGAVLYDGVVGAAAPGLVVEPLSDGRDGARAAVRVTSDRDVALSILVTGWHVVEAGFGAAMGVDARYDLALEPACAGAGPVACRVNGHDVPEPACGWLNHIGAAVVPRLEGTRDEALDAAAAVAWWALKEGVLSLANPIVYSNCNTASGDRRIGALDVCEPGRAWQVGLSGVQVPGRELAALEDAATRLFADRTVDDVLGQAASEAALDAAARAAVVASTGDLRRSWLLRVSAIGFTFQAPTVVRECVEGTRSWCQGTGWSETRLYAPDRAAALRAIDDVRAILAAVAP